MRKVQLYKYVRVDEAERHYMERVKDGVGIFHQFGMNYEEFESGAGNYSTAIVERSDGTTENIAVEMIQFLDKLK